ncbi:MAG: DEAD/DEAH box helicase [Emticicia sp.]|nr:DEAD/DEAH box helicase [Emticicia sp.]
MATQYGKTWWGQQWLNSLSKIDNSNRLPRGRTYANKGAVKDIEIEKNAIAAKVQGSAPRPYKVKVSVPIFSETQKQALLEEILSNPNLLAKLLNRELPPDLAKFAEQKNIPLFPKSWRDFPMDCSCPDYAVPCKHLAAVIYIIANEIDKNPFLVFQLHGFDVLGEVSSRYSVGKKSGIRVSTFTEFFEENPTHNVAINERIFDNIDFSYIEPLSDKLLKIIQPTPIFAEKDFKKNLEKAHKSIVKEAKKWQADERQAISNFQLGDNIEVFVSENAKIKEFRFVSTDGELRNYEKLSLEKLQNTLYLSDEKYFDRTSDSLRVLKIIHQFCLKLLENGAIIPQLLKNSSEEYFIRWLPALNNEEVKSIVTTLSHAVPANLVQFQNKKKTLSQNPEEQILTLCSLMLDYYVSLFTISMGQFYRGKVSYEMWDEFFFQQVAYEFKGFREKETPTVIQSWLNNYYITQKDFVPILRVEENEERGNFNVDVLVEDRRTQDAPIEFQKILQQKQYEPIRFEVLQDLLLLSNHFPALDAYLQQQGSRKMEFDSEEFVGILLEILPTLQLFGIQILLPKSLKHWIKPQISGTIKSKKAADVQSFMHLDDMLSFSWQIAVGEDLLSWNEFEKLIRGMKGLVKIKDRYVLIEQDELEKLKKRLENPPKLTGADLLKTALAEEYQGSKVGLSPEVIELLKDLTSPSSVKLPDNLQAELRPYQLRGYEWMVKNTKLGFGSLIADDMGLGKTLQVITLLLKFKQEGAFAKNKALIVVPTTLLTNWQKEINRFAPDLQFQIYHGAKRRLDLKSTDLVITTYGTVRSDADVFKKQQWYCVAIDEAQNIKNPDSEQTKAVKILKSDIKIAMSGTPVENRLSEFWSILDFTNKGYLGNLSKFTNEFTKPIQLDHSQEQLQVFKKITAPFLLRRIKTDKSIISDLPDKIENNHYTNLSKEQAALYETVVQQSLRDIEENEGIARKGLVLKLMTALKQIGNHPHQYLGKGKKLLEESGKAQMLIEVLENIQEANEKVLIFTQYTAMGNLLVEFIQDRFGVEPLFLHGGIDRKKRDILVERFQKNRSDSIFILSLKAGGTGLNLTQGNHVIHYDLWWNPAVENQATDRAFRIGQTKNVMVYRLINQGTMEEKIDEMIRSKRDLADMSITTGETWLGDLSNDDLRSLVKLTKM